MRDSSLRLSALLAASLQGGMYALLFALPDKRRSDWTSVIAGATGGLE